ncbi:MAG TPA: nicotinate-nucleotide adenylyltransferase [Vicinamibacterales bacterium]|nr:nicotinate-nucleotide adenylyltransferase [Vicinamibacterales bacterium]
MTSSARIGILGGTLDPIHDGHVQAALAARRGLALDVVRVLPSHVPPHRPEQPLASAYHRFAMAALAVNGVDGLLASDDELRAPGPSFTADTLERLRAHGVQTSQIFFITGADAFAEIATWRRYPDVLDLAHFVVVARPGHPVDALATLVPALATRMRPARPGAGASSSASIFLLDAPTPDVSSTEIRERLRAGRSITGLVPPAVERHIFQHGLYGAVIPADQLHGEH